MLYLIYATPENTFRCVSGDVLRINPDDELVFSFHAKNVDGKRLESVVEQLNAKKLSVKSLPSQMEDCCS